ncbi:MAG: hypothetical protein ACP5LW_04880 [Nitrososphaeria archaeon]
MSEEEEELRRKALKALRLLLIETSALPGLKGWELKKHLGKDYLNVIKVASVEADRLGMKIAIIPDDEAPKDFDRARFVLMTKEPLTESDYSRWLRIEEIASLGLILTEINLRGGSAPLEVVVRMLTEKLPRWRVNQIISKLERLGYIKEENGVLFKDWRSRVEIDETGFMKDIILYRREKG